MFRNKNKCEIKHDNIIMTRENSGPSFKVLKPNSEVKNVYFWRCGKGVKVAQRYYVRM